MYIFSATNAEFFDNLRFFVAEAVQGDTRCDYVLVVQGYRPGQEAVSGGVVGLWSLGDVKNHRQHRKC